MVTYEPAPSSGNQTPQVKGVRSRVVNSKRTNLSKGVRAKVVRDNSSFGSSNLRGYNSPAFNANTTAEYGDRKHLVRGFFGHTRFATTSKASMDGTHPHQVGCSYIRKPIKLLLTLCVELPISGVLARTIRSTPFRAQLPPRVGAGVVVRAACWY